MKRPIIILTIVLCLFYIPYANYKYENFLNGIPKNLEMEAIIISNIKKENYYNTYTINGTKGVYKNKKFILNTNHELLYGDKIYLKGTYIKPSSSRNYKGFSYKEYLKADKIYGTIKSSNIDYISPNNLNLLLMLSNSLRIKIINNIKNVLPEDTNGLLIGLLLGDKTYIDKETIQNFQASSLAHILAVSGTHVSFIILGLTFFVNHIKIPKRYGYIFIIVLLIFFLFLTNFTTSVVRACSMSIIFILSKLLYRNANFLHTIIIVLFITSLINPFILNSISLKLSYLGTIGVVFLSSIIYEKLFKTDTNLGKIISVTIAAQIAILPILIYNFNKISLIFLISNVAAIPILGISIICGFVLVFLSFLWIGLAKKIAFFLEIILKLLKQITKLCSKNIYVVTPTIVTIVLYYLVLFLLIYIYKLKKNKSLNPYEEIIIKFFNRKNIKTIITAIIIVVIAVEIPYTNYNGKLKIYFIDVGQRR